MSPTQLMFACLCWLYALSPCLLAAGASPTDAERAALARLQGQVSGQIIWESNRSGKWQLFTMNADGTGARQLLSTPQDCRSPRLSSDGRRLLFTKSVSPVKTEVWLMNSDGTGATKLIENASGADWRRSDQAVQFCRAVKPGASQHQTWEYDLRTGQERMMFPASGVKFTPEIWGGLGNDDGTRFVIWSPNPRGTWVLSADGSVQKHVHGGCMGTVSPDQRYGYGVQNPGRFIRFNLSDGEDSLVFNERKGAWDHTYYPQLSADGKWLAYAACPPSQHNHETSDYEVFLVAVNDWTTQGEPVRLTFNGRTDRDPTMFLAPAGYRNPLPPGSYDVAGNRATNPPPPPLAIHTFAQQDAAPDLGGNWGMWPTEGKCAGSASFLAEDAVGDGKGGSVKIDYQIEGPPNSVALWISPADGAVDLTAYDRFLVWAKGSVTSFTVVVEDAKADKAGGAKGVTDYLVRGVTDQWQQFELPFEEFRPREAGSTLDWRQVKIMAVALIAPQNAPRGSLHVDNLVAVAGAGG